MNTDVLCNVLATAKADRDCNKCEPRSMTDRAHGYFCCFSKLVVCFMKMAVHLLLFIYLLVTVVCLLGQHKKPSGKTILCCL